MNRSDLPFGSEFSPQQVDLARLLVLAHKHGKDWKAFEAAVRKQYFEKNKTSDYNKNKLANNTKLSMRAYGLIESQDASLTEIGRALYDIREDATTLHKALARHILKNCQGMNLVQCILDMQAAGEETRAQMRLVEAAHILPVPAEGSSDHVSNGISLAPTLHRAYDNCLIFLDTDLVMRLNEERAQQLVTDNLDAGLDTLRASLGNPIHLPVDVAQRPNPAFIERANAYRRIPEFL